MSTTQAVPQDKDTAIPGELYMSFELGDKCWKLTASDGRHSASHYSVHAGDTVAVLDCARRAKAGCGLDPLAKVHSCYEAGRDGWWLHRWLTAQGIDNVVVDAASIEVNRRARRAKTESSSIGPTARGRTCSAWRNFSCGTNIRRLAVAQGKARRSFLR
jgi:transposase